jgi:hypothetical protein
MTFRIESYFITLNVIVWGFFGLFPKMEIFLMRSPHFRNLTLKTIVSGNAAENK